MKRFVLDGRDIDSLRREFARLAGAYTPEWRLENSQDDPGAALEEIFCHMLEQSVDRMNSIPDKLFTDFLNLIGFRLPAPAPASGILQFTAHDTVDEAVRVPADTQVFTPDEEGMNIVYETERSIEATPARLMEVYYADSDEDRLERIDLSSPRQFFVPGTQNLQSHRFWFSHPDTLRLDCPCKIEVELRQDVRYLESQTAGALAQMRWRFPHAGALLPFDAVNAENGKIVLEKHNALPNWEEGETPFIICEAEKPEISLMVEGIKIRSSPIERVNADMLFSGDLRILPGEGGYCFGKSPAPYALFYVRSDAVFTKRGAAANLHLEITPIVSAPPEQPPQYSFNQAIIDKSSAVARKPDDVFVSEVAWEYFNGLGWRQMEVEGDRNPFSCKREGTLEVRFTVPPDIVESEVNAEHGMYIRARVVEVQNQYSDYARWIVPFIRGAGLLWAYDEPVAVSGCGAENNGSSVTIEEAGKLANLNLLALSPMEPSPKSMYFRFDKSPHAMPLSVMFELTGRTPLTDKLAWEYRVGDRFESITSVDLTDNLRHMGQVMLYLSEPLTETELFGMRGFWLRVSRSSDFEGPAPCVSKILLNTVNARQVQREETLFFDTAPYDAGKVVNVLRTPVAECEVWVDEVSVLPVADARELAEREPQNVRFEWADTVLTHCWVRWHEVRDLALAPPGARAFSFDPYEGTVRFGDGARGRVPAPGRNNIEVRYTSGGGARGNVPEGSIVSLVGSLPRISGVRNITPMSGGTDRFPQERIEQVGNKRLRHRGRAAGARDFEEMVLEAFPQVRHIRAFPGRNAKGKSASGHVTIVVTGTDENDTADNLCNLIYGFLSERCDCCMAAEGRLHVRPAVMVRVNAHISVELESLDQAAEIQRAIVNNIQGLIDDVWRKRHIGSQIRVDEIWRAVRDTPGVRFIDKIQTEGAYDEDGQPRLIPLEQQTELPYAVVRSGVHRVKVR